MGLFSKSEKKGGNQKKAAVLARDKSREHIVTCKTDKGRVEFNTRRAEGFVHEMPMSKGYTESGFPKEYKGHKELPFKGKNTNSSAILGNPKNRDRDSKDFKEPSQCYIECPIHPSKGGQPHPIHLDHETALPGYFRTISTLQSRDFVGIIYHPKKGDTTFKLAHRDCSSSSEGSSSDLPPQPLPAQAKRSR